MSDLRELLNVAKNVRKQYQWADKAVTVIEETMRVENGLGAGQRHLAVIQKKVEEAQSAFEGLQSDHAMKMKAMDEQFRQSRERLSSDLAEKRKIARDEIQAIEAESKRVEDMWRGKIATLKETFEALKGEVAVLQGRKESLDKDIEKLKARVQKA